MTFGKMIFTCAVSSLLVFNVAFAENTSEVDPLANISVSKHEISGSLDRLKNEGKISEKDYHAAKAELANMSDAHVTAIKEMAVGMIRNDPDKALSLVQAPQVDLAEAERQIKALSNPK